jgi:hypothetical protein
MKTPAPTPPVYRRARGEKALEKLAKVPISESPRDRSARVQAILTAMFMSPAAMQRGDAILDAMLAEAQASA